MYMTAFGIEQEPVVCHIIMKGGHKVFVDANFAPFFFHCGTV